MMCEPVRVSTANAAGQSLYAKLQKLSEDIQLQHSIITAQKETVLKSRQLKALEVQKTEPSGDQTHLVHTHAGTVMQHRAMIIKHYELIQQHKQMVKEQGLHVQNLTSALLNIQQETTVVDELMNTKMAEAKCIEPPPTSTTLTITDSIGPSTRNGKTKRMKNKRNSANTIVEINPKTSPDTSVLEPCIESVEIENIEPNKQVTTITTSTSTTTTTTPTSTTTEITTISLVSTPTSTTTTATTTTTTTISAPSSPRSCNIDIELPLPLSP